MTAVLFRNYQTITRSTRLKLQSSKVWDKNGRSSHSVWQWSQSSFIHSNFKILSPSSACKCTLFMLDLLRRDKIHSWSTWVVMKYEEWVLHNKKNTCLTPLGIGVMRVNLRRDGALRRELCHVPDAELTSNQHTEKHIGSCIPNSGLFFSTTKFSFLQIYFLVISHCTLYFLCTLFLH